jgi:hypothetical protein
VAEVFVEFTEHVATKDGDKYIARACGGENDRGMWQGWIEFVPLAGGEVVRTGRETTQPNRTDTEYWATGLTAVFLEGALHRALHPLVRPEPPFVPPPVHGGPAPDFVVTPLRASSTRSRFTARGRRSCGTSSARSRPGIWSTSSGRTT